VTFILNEIVEQVHAAYSDLTETAICAEFGNLAKAKNSDTPRIVWTLTGGTFGDSTRIGGPDAGIAKALPSFWVWLWFDDLAQCWNAMENMCAAIRQVMVSPPPAATDANPNPQGTRRFRLVKFDCPSEIEGRNMDKGEVIVLTVELSSEIRMDGTRPASEVTLETHESRVTLEEDFAAVDAGDEDPFEAVLVVGPIP
jgi:hypothetical protein